jgi:hypothetical protein
MTAAIDRFLYRATADVVVSELDDALGELIGAFEDLDTIINPEACSGCLHIACNECYGDNDGKAPKINKRDLVAGVVELRKRRSELYAALESAQAHVSDFVEANRP